MNAARSGAGNSADFTANLPQTTGTTSLRKFREKFRKNPRYIQMEGGKPCFLKTWLVQITCAKMARGATHESHAG